MSYAIKNTPYTPQELEQVEKLHKRLQDAFGSLRQRQLVLLELLSECLEHHVHLLRGHSSLDQYLKSELQLPPASAWRYASAAKAIRKDPKQLELFRKGSATLTTLAHAWSAYKRCVLPERRAHLKLSNLPLPKGLSQNSPPSKRKLSSLPPESHEEAHLFLTSISTLSTTEALEKVQSLTHAHPKKRKKIRTQSGCHVNLFFTPEQLALLERLEELWSQKIPNRNLEQLFSKAIEYILNREDPLRKQAKPRSKGTSPFNLTKALKAAVIRRDQGMCQFQRKNGTLCGSKHYIHIDHILPLSRGGKNTLDNLRCLCSTHNMLTKDRAASKRVGSDHSFSDTS